MLVVGAGGFAKQLLPALIENGYTEQLAFYDEANPAHLQLYNFPVLKSAAQAQAWFKEKSPSFCLGLGKPINRYWVASRFTALGGELTSVISTSGVMLAPHVELRTGITLLAHAIIENDAVVGEGALINVKATICHETTVGQYCELAPGAIMLGRTQLGDFSFLGAGVVINPMVKVGSNVIIGAGAVVNKDVPDNCVMAGVPAKKLRDLPPLSLQTS